MTLPDLRDVLHEHGDGPSPANPARPEQVLARIRRIRLRRRALGGGGVVAMAAAVALGLSLLSGTAEPRLETADEPTTFTAQLAGLLPERFTAADGTKYRRIATTSIKRTGPTKVSVTIPFSGKPLDVGAVCAGPDTSAPRASIGADGPASAHFGACSRRMQLRPLQVPAATGSKELTVTFDTTTTGWGCAVRDGKCVPQKKTRGVWALAVYEWTPPAQAVKPPSLKELPDHAGKARLVEKKTGVWPQDTSATFKVRGKVGFDTLCTGALAGNLWFNFEVNGREEGSGGACGVWEGGAFPSAVSEFSYPTDRTTTVKVKWTLRGGGTNRPVRWSVGLYRK
ncbi:hypothetical protein [Nonomuraea sp. NEAU-A123]|uniref:hypothetical protein n=1 Tax=Nonomuraea sp. NEAU-A123 TaxID=2839649 RepID=UPI001BE3FB7C|nr:hypothetical protein [Nonomuraea sp. NEAU-A123]MBT2235281.1 hypothetical protein [Nonomuraea sp. NEAU-A123]